MEIKTAAFAGSWYPRDKKGCEVAIQGFLKEKSGPLKGDFTAGVVPHAGWVFSGAIACRVMASLVPARGGDAVDTVLLFGCHMHENSQSYVMGGGAVETPFGMIEVDTELADGLASDASLGIQSISPSKFPQENTLELQYPFIKYFFPNARILVSGVAPSSLAARIGRAAVAHAMDLNRNIKIIGSTDMSHYGPGFGFTPAGTGPKAVDWVTNQNDAKAIASMKSMDEDAILEQGLEHHNMCCPGAVAATVAAAKKMGAAKAFLLDYATSFETSRSDSFVGYSGLLYG